MTLRIVVVATDAFEQSTEALLSAGEAASAHVASVAGMQAPPVERILDTLAGAGVLTSLLIPASASGRKNWSWVRRVAGEWVRTRGTMRVFVADTPARSAADVAGAVADARTRGAAGIAGCATLVDGSEPGLQSPAWNKPPPFTHHVLLCRGPRCNSKGAAALCEALQTELRNRDLLDQSVLITLTGCQFPCNNAPSVVVYPENTWHAGLTVNEVSALCDRLAAHSRGEPASRCTQTWSEPS